MDQSFSYDRFGNRTVSSISAPAGALASDSEALSWTASYPNGNDLPATVSVAGGSLSTGVQYDDLGRMRQVWTTPGQPSTQTSWIYDPSGRVVGENGTNYLLDSEGLRFKRTMADGTTQYTIYGFARDPLSVFVKTPQIVTAAQMRTLAATSTTRKSVKTTKATLIGGNPVGAYIDAPDASMTLFVGQAVAQTLSIDTTPFKNTNYTFLSPELVASVAPKTSDLSLNTMSGFDANTKVQFSQSSGVFTMNTVIGGTNMVSVIGTGWSGNGDGKKNPAMEGVKDVGPTPHGTYRIGNPGSRALRSQLYSTFAFCIWRSGITAMGLP